MDVIEHHDLRLLEASGDERFNGLKRHGIRLGLTAEDGDRSRSEEQPSDGPT